jgi:Multiubiquitin
MSSEEMNERPGDDQLEQAIGHLKEAEQDLVDGRSSEAGREVREALEELEHARHNHWVVVNGRRKKVHTNRLTFDEVVRLAFDPPPHGDGVQITVQYTRGPEHKPSGTLVEGQSVKVRDGMEFDVTATNRS